MQQGLPSLTVLMTSFLCIGSSTDGFWCLAALCDDSVITSTALIMRVEVFCLKTAMWLFNEYSESDIMTLTYSLTIFLITCLSLSHLWKNYPLQFECQRQTQLSDILSSNNRDYSEIYVFSLKFRPANSSLLGETPFWNEKYGTCMKHVGPVAQQTSQNMVAYWHALTLQEMSLTFSPALTRSSPEKAETF